MIDAYRELILDAGDVEEGLDLLPQLPPGPGTELQVLAQVALDNLESQPLENTSNNHHVAHFQIWRYVQVSMSNIPLFLQLLVLLTGQVTTDVGLEPRDDLGQPVVTQLFHLTQDTGAEEYLLVQGKC